MFALKIILPRKANSQLSIRLLESKEVRVEWFSEFDSTLNQTINSFLKTLKSDTLNLIFWPFFKVLEVCNTRE